MKKTMKAELCFVRKPLNSYFCETKEKLIVAMNQCGCKDVVVKDTMTWFNWKWCDYRTIGIQLPGIFDGQTNYPCYLVHSENFLKIFSEKEFEEYYVTVK